MDVRIEYLDEHMDALATLAEWHHAEWLAVTPHLSVADRIVGFAARAKRGSIPTGFVGLVDDAVVGMACLVECDIPSHCHLTPWLATLLVSTEHRKKGIGSALCERATEEARRLGVTTLHLFTFDKQSLYERLGWSLLEEATYAGSVGTIMVRRLLPKQPPPRTSGAPADTLEYGNRRSQPLARRRKLARAAAAPKSKT